MSFIAASLFLMNTSNRVFFVATFVAFVLSGFVAAIHRTPLSIAAYVFSAVAIATFPLTRLFDR